MTRSAPPATGGSHAGGESEPVLTGREHRRLADVLLKAARDGRPAEPFTGRYPELRLTDACRIRDAVLARRTAAGERLVGAKTRIAPGPAPRRIERRLGLLTSGMLLPSAAVEIAQLIHPCVEPKLAFVLGGPPGETMRTGADLLAGTLRVVPSMEVVDSRYDPRHPSPLDDLADSYGASRLLLGEGVPPSELPRDRLTVRLETDVLRLEFEGGALSPLGQDGTAWFESGAIEQRGDLGAGTFLLSPALAPPLELDSPVRIRADFGGLGSLQLAVR